MTESLEETLRAQVARLREALEESQSLLAAMLHETRPPAEIAAQMKDNRAALTPQEQS